MASKEINVGIIGVGKNGSAFARAYQACEYTRIAAVCDTDQELAREIAQRHGAAHVYQDLSIIDRADLDLISIHTPDHQHAEPVVRALKAGKHVFVEKPLADTLEDLRRIVTAARAAPGKVMVGHVLRFNPIFRAIKEMVDEGQLGKLFYVEGDYIHDLRWQSGWNLTNELPMVGGGCHPIDLLRWFAGNVSEVQAYGNHEAFPEMTNDDCVVGILRFVNGCVGKVSAMYGPRAPMAPLYNIAAYGTHGTVVRDQVCLNNMDLFMQIPLAYTGHPYDPEVAHFADCILNDRIPLVSVLDGANAVAVALAIQEAFRTGQAVQPIIFE